MHRLAKLAAAAATALVLAAMAHGGPSLAHERGPSYSLMQMNLCLSGFARCYGRVAYPAGAEDAVARIRAARPDAVTLNETCRRDVARIAQATGYQLRFSTVRVSGRPLRCVRPGGRGAFGDAVLTRAPVASAESADFAAQSGPEWRRWLCVTTRAGIDVCTAHLASTGNGAQCAELAAILTRRAATRPVIFGGDVNRRSACAPEHAWTRSDAAAGQAPGLQGVYGTGRLRGPAAEILPAARTDHDVLLVRARLVRP
jgi:endonuclease/exonuclease/phosphatase family metal-dependent hydrolase